MTFRRVVTAMLAWSILAATNVTAGAGRSDARRHTGRSLPPRGLSDIAARAFAVKLQQRLGQSVPSWKISRHLRIDRCHVCGRGRTPMVARC